MSKICFLFVVILVVGCQQIGPAYTLAVDVENRTNAPVDYLAFSNHIGQGRLETFALKPQQKVNVTFDFTDVAKTDGLYQVRYRFAGSADTLTKTFGYYTNGYPIDQQISLTVHTDSLSVKTVLRKNTY
ncbi:hypothetical protein [Spirosoma utsteinense]|uniref:Uncharacterized protein n=1 Tax=Spirosoma utsteinense TaxID=2585773 RepID=A0ABR6W0E7_9BACT|nr:hypothetical protein [Spirosoma utsteinense]MBC3784584.1 hypothetical protein [Spirosoma utsteinense]MBC3789664.1 hypothetical protein [Spirosoma utsteinense]